mmetsp:Transcript_26551/g.61629  ORF Transcript_26551/g.61629 Transcript_26551/m.61629 type:complete len:592 (-) Transcript_26551:5-1780(-)
MEAASPSYSAKHYAWTVAAASSDWKNDSGAGYEDGETTPRTPGRRSSLGAEDKSWGATSHDKPHMSITQVLEEQEDTEVKITSLQAGIILFKSSIGVAILGMPFAFRNSGIFVGQAFLVFNALVTCFTTKLLVSCKRHLQETRHRGIVSLPDMAYALWGPMGLIFTNIVLVVCQIGNCIAYGIFLSVSSTAVLKEVFPHYDLGEHSYDSAYLLMTCGWGVLFVFLVQIEHMSRLAPFLYAAQIAMMTALVLIITYGLIYPSVCDKDGYVSYFCKVHYGLREQSFPIFIGIAVFALEGVPTILLVENSMRNPEDFELVYDRAMTAVTMVMIVFGTMSYWLYGAHTKSVISLNTEGMTGALVKSLLCMVICLSYPLQYLPVSQILDMIGDSDVVNRVYIKIPTRLHLSGVLGRTREDFSRRVKQVLKICGVIVGSVVTVIFPHFGHVLSILGSVLFSYVVYICPSLLYLVAKRGEVSRSMKMACCFTVCFGFTVMALGLWSNIVHVQHKGVYYPHAMKIEQAPPKVGSRKAKQEQHIFKSAAGMTKKGEHHLIKSEVDRGVQLPPPVPIHKPPKAGAVAAIVPPHALRPPPQE